MRLQFRNQQGQWRNGWKSLFFVLAGMACFVITGLVARALPVSFKAFAPSAILISTLGLLLSWQAVRMEGRQLADIGLRLNARFMGQLGLGLLGGALMIVASAALVHQFAGVELLSIEPPTLATQVRIVLSFLGGALFEELLFRGYAFQRALNGMGRWPAIAVFAGLFALGHVPGNLEVPAPMLVTALAGLMLDAVIQSLILLRTGSLALPIGLHFGWNLLQQSLGFGVSGISGSPGWFRVELGSQPGWLTGGEFGLEASVFAVLVQLPLLVWLLWPQRSSRAPVARAVSA